MNRVVISKQGVENLRDELNELKLVKRPEVIEEIAVARDHGDLKENAEYHAAREKQSFIEGRIGEIEGVLSQADVIDYLSYTEKDTVKFGATIKIEDEDGNEKCYKILGNTEGDITKNIISITSPIAKSFIGKKVGDLVNVNAPGGVIEYELISIEYI